MPKKLRIVFKDPDGVYDAVKAYAQNSLAAAVLPDCIDHEQLVEQCQDKLFEQLKHWLEHGEYVTLEFDLETMTARVVEPE